MAGHGTQQLFGWFGGAGPRGTELKAAQTALLRGRARRRVERLRGWGLAGETWFPPRV